MALVSGVVFYVGVLAAGVSAIGGLAKRDAQMGAALLANALREEPSAAVPQPASVSIGQVPVDGTAFEHARPAPRFIEQHDADEIEQMKREVSERVVLDDPTPWRAADAQRTYKTMCVRLCDGAYFPISFATTRDRFANDEAACRSRCGSPARLFVFPNPGGSPDSMQDRSGRSYIELPTAFQFRRGSVQGCSCRAQPWEIASQERHRRYALQAEREKGLTVDVADLDTRHSDAEVSETDASGAPDRTSLVSVGESSLGFAEPREGLSPQRPVMTAALGDEGRAAALPLPVPADPTATEMPMTVGSLPPLPERADDAAAAAARGGQASEGERRAVVKAPDVKEATAETQGERRSASRAGQRREQPRLRHKATLVVAKESEPAVAPSKLPRMISFQYDETVIWGVGRNSHSAPRGGSAHDAFARNFY